MKLRNTLLVFQALIALASPAFAIQINWGSELDSDFRDSFGNSLDDAYAIQLGYFEKVLGEQFVPTSANAAEWSSHWKVFDQAAFDPSTGYFTSSVTLNADGSSSSDYADNDLGLNFLNQDAYIWIHNSETPAPDTEWFLGRSSEWRTPESTSDCCDTRVISWSVSDFESSDVPVYGKQGDVTGSGSHTNDGPYTIQTFTFDTPSLVPEPSSSLLLALGGVALVLRRRRTAIS